MNIKIRPEQKKDFDQITHINDLAFAQTNEGVLIEKLRKNPKFIPSLSLVAELENMVIGHILFFPIHLKSSNLEIETLALAPMSVIPEFQNMGIGSELVKKGLEQAKIEGFESVIVLGYKDFYERFGFKPASLWQIKAPFDVKDENFMAIELFEGSLHGISGIVEYPKEFEEVE